MANKKSKKNVNAIKIEASSASRSQQSKKTNSKEIKLPAAKQNQQKNKNDKKSSKCQLAMVEKENNLPPKKNTSKNNPNATTIVPTKIEPPSQLISPKSTKIQNNNVNAISYAQTVGYDHCINNVKYITQKIEPAESNSNVRQNRDIDSNRQKMKTKGSNIDKKISFDNNHPEMSIIATNFTCDKCFLPSRTIISDAYSCNLTGSALYYKRTTTSNNSKHNHRRNSTQLHFHTRKSDNGNRDRKYVAKHTGFVKIAPPSKPILSSSNIVAVIADTDKMIIIEKLGKGKHFYPIMQCGTLEAPDSSYHIQRSNRMDVFQIDDGFHSDGGTETPPPSPSSASSIASTSDHGSLESVDTGGAQRLAVLSFEQVRKLHDVMDETVAIHGRGNFPTLEVKLKDLVNLVRRKLEADVVSGGAGVIVKDIRLNGGAASHVLASENQPYNDLDLIYAIEFSSSRHFDRVKSAVLNTLMDLLPEGVSKRRIMPCALKEAYVGKMVKVNNNNDGDRWSLISLGNSPGHKNVELKFVDTMRRQFEFSVDSFQIVLDSLLLFYDCAALPISENFYPTVVGESVYGDFQEALYHLQKKLISTRQPEEIRGGGLLKYCNLLVRNYKPVDSQRIKTLERYMCSRFFIDFPDINTQTVKLEAYLRNHFWGIDEEPLQYQYLMHLREVVETSTVCLMGHERRQTLLLIQSLAMQVLCHEQHKNHQVQAHEQYHHLQQQQADMQQVVQQQQQQQHHMLVQQQQQQQNSNSATATMCCQVSTSSGSQDTQQQQQTTAAAVVAHHQQQQQAIPQTIQIQAGPPGLIYANGVYYAPVIPATICTCNSTWLST